MLQNKCFILGDEKIEIVKRDAYLDLMFSIYMERGFSVTNYALETNVQLIKSVLATLTDRERKVIEFLFGLNGVEKKTIEEVAKQFDVTKEQIEGIKNKSLRGLRNPTRCMVLTGKKSNELANQYYDYYFTRLKDLIIDEIQSLIQGEGKYLVHIDRLMQKNNFKILNKYPGKIDFECDLEDMGLSGRTYDILKCAGITNFTELTHMSAGELKHIPNMGRKTYEEIKRKMNEYAGIPDDNCRTIIFDRCGQKTIYKYLEMDTQKIASSIYVNMIKIEPNKRFILNSDFSPGLTEILLQKGYMYVEDVIEDSERLEKQLLKFGFEDYSSELRNLRELNQIQIENKFIYVLPYDDFVVKYIEENHCKSVNDFVEKSSECENEKVKELVQSILIMQNA